jgi:energy-coupling factor transporter ATP-binding protein EcfA2
MDSKRLGAGARAGSASAVWRLAKGFEGTILLEQNSTCMQQDMQLLRFEVDGLFGRYHHTIDFPISKPDRPQPSIVILHGENGIGKTTVLRMIDGLLRLDFNVFRQNPFNFAELQFSIGGSIRVECNDIEARTNPLVVRFNNMVVKLNPLEPGGMTEADVPGVEAFREAFSKARESLAFEFIDTSRMLRQRPPDDERMTHEEYFIRLKERPTVNPKALSPRGHSSISERVAKFINEAQVNYRRFFATSESDLFENILNKLMHAAETEVELQPLLDRLAVISDQNTRFKGLGIEVDGWDRNHINKVVSEAAKGAAQKQALAALAAFVEVFEARAAERALLADRLDTFLCLMKEFFHDKIITLSPKDGLIIRTTGAVSRVLGERQLSTGEFHLLYLLVAALVTQRRGTIIAIDEPEMSMHLAWQRTLIRALVRCASKAEPQFIFATHSPDIAADFPGALKEIK